MLDSIYHMYDIKTHPLLLADNTMKFSRDEAHM